MTLSKIWTTTIVTVELIPSIFTVKCLFTVYTLVADLSLSSRFSISILQMYEVLHNKYYDVF
jgi:hypothetical protein